MKDESGQDLVEYALAVALIAFVVTAGLSTLAKDINDAFKNVGSSLRSEAPQPTSRVHGTELAEILKKDCEHLVEGQLLFEPDKTMKQGVPDRVFARVTRNPNVNIAKDIDSSAVKIESAQVSCQVSMLLDGGKDFNIANSPPDRKNQQFVDINSFTEWDWQVTPKKSGNLRLLLYVTPYLYVENISEPMEKAFPQPPRIITVQADYAYATKTFIEDHWAVLGVILTAILIPIYHWSRGKIIEWKKVRDAKKPKGFMEDIPRS